MLCLIGGTQGAGLDWPGRALDWGGPCVKAFGMNIRESWWFAATNSNEWVELQLPKPTNLIGSLVVWEKDSTWYDFTISVSSDGKTWREVW